MRIRYVAVGNFLIPTTRVNKLSTHPGAVLVHRRPHLIGEPYNSFLAGGLGKKEEGRGWGPKARFLNQTHSLGNSPTSVGRNGQEAMSIWGESLLGEARGMENPCASLTAPLAPGLPAPYLDPMSFPSEKPSITL